MTKEYNFLVMSPTGDVHTTAGNEMPPPASTGPYKTTHHTSPIPERKTYSKEKEEVSYLHYLFSIFNPSTNLSILQLDIIKHTTIHNTSLIPERKTYSKEKEEVSYLNLSIHPSFILPSIYLYFKRTL